MNVDPRIAALAAETAAALRAAGRDDLARSLVADADAVAARPPAVDLAVAGRAGSGKTTLIKALASVLEPGSHRLTELPEAAVAGADADAVLLLLDPEAPIGELERRLAIATARRAAEVVFVLAKADLSLHTGVLLEADIRVLAGLGPRWAGSPLYAVSAHEHALARSAGDAGLAAESGIPALAEHLLARLIPYPAVLRSAVVVARCRAAVRELRRTDAAPASVGAGEAAVARHRAYVERTTDWTAEFGREYHRRMRQVVERDLRLKLLERREARDLRIKSGRMALDEVTANVKQDLEAVAELMGAALVEEVQALVADWSWRLELGPVELETRVDGAGTPLPEARIDLATVQWHEREVAHGVTGAVNMARSAATGRSLAGVLPGGLAMGTGLGIVLTGLTWLTSEWLRTRMQDQQGALTFVQAAFARAQIDLEAALRDQASMLHPIAQGTLDRAIAEQRRSLATAAAGLQQQEADQAAQHAAAVEAAAARERLLAPVTERLDALADRMTAFLRKPQQ